MKVDLHVNAVLATQIDRLVDLFENRLLQLSGARAVGPTSVIERQPDEVKPELGDIGDIALLKPLLLVDHELVEQVEPAPTR